MNHVSPPVSPRRVQVLDIVCLAAAYVAVNFSVVFFWSTRPGDAWWPGLLFCGGMLGAEVVVVSLVTTLAPGPFGTRLLWSLAAALLFSAAWFAGVWTNTVLEQRSVTMIDHFATSTVANLPWLAFASQVPLWVMRLWGGWQLTTRESVVDRPLAIRDLLFGTALAAAVFWALRFGNEANELVPLLVMFGLVALLSTLAFVPLLLAALRSVKPAVMVPLTAALSLLVYVVLIGLIVISDGLPSPDFLGAMCGLYLGYLGGTLGGLLLLRLRGVRLVRAVVRGRPLRVGGSPS